MACASSSRPPSCPSSRLTPSAAPASPWSSAANDPPLADARRRIPTPGHAARPGSVVSFCLSDAAFVGGLGPSDRLDAGQMPVARFRHDRPPDGLEKPKRPFRRDPFDGEGNGPLEVVNLLAVGVGGAAG